MKLNSKIEFDNKCLSPKSPVLVWEINYHNSVLVQENVCYNSDLALFMSVSYELRLILSDLLGSRLSF